MSLIVEPQPVPLTTSPEGVVRVSGTRVPLETIIRAFYHGATPEAIAEDFPTLTLAQVYAVLAYYLANQPEVDAYVAEQARRSEEVRLAHEARFDPVGIRARLLTRKAQQESAA
jgi:uncharacterized protein (DUF433 family)